MGVEPAGQLVRGRLESAWGGLGIYTCETFCARSSGMLFICMVIGLECRLGVAERCVAAQVRGAQLGCWHRLGWLRRRLGCG